MKGLCCPLNWLFLFVVYPAQSQWVQRKTAILEGDLTIGYLFSMHEQPEQRTAHTRKCGSIWEEYGIQRAEVTFQTIERINADPNILPGIRLGVEIRDDCWYAPVALEQTLEFIRDAVTARNNKPPGAVVAAPGGLCSRNGTVCAQRLAGVIGPGSSAVSIQVQNLLQLFHIPQIGYSATSRDLSDKNRFRYFLRVVPPDELQAQAMLQILQKYNWTYVSAISTEGSYGESGLQVFREYADREDICIAKEYSILSNDDDEKYDRLLNRMLEEPKARVLVCFCEGETVNAILKAIRRFNKTGHFLLVGSDGWADRLDVVKGYEAEAEGGISIRIHSPKVANFDAGYFALKPDDPNVITRNPWFSEFWEHKFDCTLPNSSSSSSSSSSAKQQQQRQANSSAPASVSSSATRNKTCTGKESLRDKYKQDTKMGFVIKATMAMAWALHNLHQNICGPGSYGLCPSMLPIDGSRLRDHLMSVSFAYGNETVQFDSNGNPPGWYDIMNYQKTSSPTPSPSDRYSYVKIGSWKNGTLDLPERPVKMLTSVCSEPCATGQVKIIQKELSCCWQCVSCEVHQRVLNETACQDCPWGYWPDANKTECEEIEPEFSRWSDGESIAAVTLSVVGLLATLATATVFAWHNNTPVVKASTRELTYLILVGMALCYLTTFPLLAVPDQFTCILSRVLPGLSFSLIFAALLTKTNRIARILAGSKKRIRTEKSRWLSLTAQILITMTMIGIEGMLIVAMLILEPADSVKHFPSRSRVLIICNTTTRGLMAPLCFDFFLIGMCTVYAVKTRNLPENFNEAKFIGFAMYTTCVIWVAFVPIYFSASESKTITLCICVSLSAVVTLVLLFGPKLYIIIFKPEKNNRSAFTTSADLRIHIASGTNAKYNPNQSSAFSSSSRLRNSSVTAQSSCDGGQSNLSHRAASTRAIDKAHGPHSNAVPKSSISSNGQDQQSRANMTFLRRAFGSQLDLTDGASIKQSNRRSVECQTDDGCVFVVGSGVGCRPAQPVDKDEWSDATSSSDSEDSSWSRINRRQRRWTSIIEKRVTENAEEADIIISLGHRSNRQLDDEELYSRLESMGITVSKSSDVDIL